MGDPENQEVIDEFEKKPRKLIDPCNIDTNSRKYWKRIFQAMDEYSAIPYHKRLNVLETTLNDPGLVYRLQSIYDIHKHDEIIDFDKILSGDTQIVDEVPLTEKPMTAFADYNTNQFTPYPDVTMAVPRKIRSSLRARPPSDIKLGQRPTIDYRKELTKAHDESAVEGESMYAAFLRKPPEEASRWRPKPPLTLEGMTLAEKCDAITREIATNFVEWMDSLGGETKSSLNIEGIEGLFEIGFNCHAADSLKVNVQELNAVTEYVAHARQTPELSYSTQLYRQLYRDRTAVRSREANFAFGTMLPPEMRSGTTEDSDVMKWLENKRVPEKLATMAVVWEDIESLKSTEGYCNWLIEHEDIPPPSYLVHKGMLESRRKPSASIIALVSSNSQQSQSKVTFTSDSSSII